MSETNTPENNTPEPVPVIEMDVLLKQKFVTDMLGCMARLRDAVGDSEGLLTNDELVAKVKASTGN